MRLREKNHKLTYDQKEIIELVLIILILIFPIIVVSIHNLSKF